MHLTNTRPGAAKSCSPLTETKAIRVPFGLRIADGRMYAPREVPLGQLCGCICPACEGELISRHELNGRKIPHFSHAAGADCAKGLETAVHLAAKQLIDQEKRLFLPKVEALLEKTNALGAVHRRNRTFSAAGLASLTNVRSEAYLGSFRPDVLATPVGLSEICVEIAVTHYVDDNKLTRVRQAGIPLMEIDLAGYRSFTWDSLREALLTDRAPRKWLYHPEVEAAIASWEESLKPILAAIQKEADEAKARQREAEKAWLAEEERALEEQERQWQLQRTAEKAAQAVEAKKNRAAQQDARERAQRFKRLLEAEKIDRLCKVYQRDRLPSVLAARVTGGSSFGVKDALVWQAALFRGLIEGSATNGISKVNKDAAVVWLKERFTVEPEFADAEKKAVWYYLLELANRGALTRERDGNFRLMVAGFQALETLQAFRRGTVSVHKGLTWSALETWPSSEVATTIALAHANTSELYGQWQQVSTLLPVVREKSLAEVLARYAGSSGGTGLLEYWISAGFVVRR